MLKNRSLSCRLALAVLLAALLAISASCRGFFTKPVLKSINISPSNPSVVKGGTLQFTANGVNNDNTTSSNVSATWQSSDSTVATIDASGLATAKSTTGPCTITATSTADSSLTATTTLTVTTTAVTVTLASGSTSTISAIGGTAQLKATETTVGGSAQDVTSSATWNSSNTTVATVTAGVVTGLTAGTTNITASSSNSGTTVTSNQVTITVTQ